MEQVFLYMIERFNANRFWVMPVVLLVVVTGLAREIWLVFKDVLKEMDG